MFKNLVECFNVVTSNVWAGFLIVVAGTLAVVAHFGGDDHLLAFATTIATSAATLFNAKPKEGT